MGDNRFVGGLYLKKFIAAAYLIFHKNHYSIFSIELQIIMSLSLQTRKIKFQV
jgi:hypothetical protein